MMARAALRTWVGSGGLAPAGARWLPCRPHFFLPVKVLSQRFRRLFLMALEHVYSRGEFPRFGCFGRLYHGFPTQRTEGHHIARVLRHDLSDLIVIERASGGNDSSQCGISTWAEDSRRRITTTPIRLNAMDSNRTSRNEPVA
jgi:hypothetical protein